LRTKISVQAVYDARDTGLGKWEEVAETPLSREVGHIQRGLLTMTVVMELVVLVVLIEAV